METIILVVVFFAAFMFIQPVLKFIIGKQKSIFRLKNYLGEQEQVQNRKKEERKESKSGLDIISKRIGSAKFLDGYKTSTQAKLTRAHILLKAEEYIAVCLIVFFVITFLTAVITGNLGFGIVLGIVGWFFPGLVIKAKTQKRLKVLNDQLGDAITLISNSLKAGYSFFQAVETVAEEMQGPIAEEFKTMQKEINFGIPTEKALENLSKRVDSDDLDLVVTAVLIQRQIGGNLSEVLDNISSTIRERVKIKGEVKTLTAQGRLSGIIIALLPPVLCIVLMLINPQFVGVLFKDPIGLAIVGFSVMMEFIGIIVIKKIVNIEV